MALYTSYYTRQLALRPTGAGGELQQEGEKLFQKTVARRTVDYTGPFVTWFEVSWVLGGHGQLLSSCQEQQLL